MLPGDRGGGTTYPLEIHRNVPTQTGASTGAGAQDRRPQPSALSDAPAEQRERASRPRLEELHDVVNALSATTSREDLCREAVKLGQTRLDFDRLSIWITDDTPNEARGSFGIDETGAVRDERGQRTGIGGASLMAKALANERQCYVEHGSALRNHRLEVVGHGDHAVVALWDGRRVIGFVTMDNLLRGRPIAEADCETLTLFATSVAHLYTAKRAEEAMQRSEQRFRELAEMLPQTVYEIDTTGRLTFVNHYAFEMFGYSREDFEAGLNAIDMLSPECRAIAMERLGRVFRGEPQQGNEYTGLRKDGSRFPVVIYSAPILQDGVCQGARGFIIDISDRKRAEESLQERERFITRVVDSSLNGIYIYDVASGKPVFVNRRYTQITGYTRDDLGEMAAGEFLDLCHPEDKDRLAEHIRAVVNSGPGAAFEIEYRHRTKDGRWIWLLASDIAFERDERGRVRRLTGSFTDMTQRRELEEELRQAQKMEAIGTLAGGIAHDFNNLLQGVLGYASLAANELPQGHPALSSLAQIRKAGERAASLTRQLLAFSRRDMARPEVLDVNEIVAETVRMLTRLIGEHIRLRIDATRDVWPVCVDRGQLGQVVLNLCVNARDAMPAGGEIRIGARRATLTKEDCAP